MNAMKKTIIFLIVFTALLNWNVAATASSAPMDLVDKSSIKANEEQHSIEENDNLDNYRNRRAFKNAAAAAAAAAAAGYQISAPPCAKNYMFSCQPSLAPVSCANNNGIGVNSPVVGGYQAAYNAPVPVYAQAQPLLQPSYKLKNSVNYASPGCEDDVTMIDILYQNYGLKLRLND
uniref:VM domain-containing protein n=1 Tax=Glossina austeni TaxID=7395 RepID=A0A1A9VSV1_GLOAU